MTLLKKIVTQKTRTAARLPFKGKFFKKTVSRTLILTVFAAILCTLMIFTKTAFCENFYDDYRINTEEKQELIKTLNRIDKNGNFEDVNKFIHPLSRKLFEWALFLQGGVDLPFGQLSAFITENPDWPEMAKLRLRSEANMPKDVTPAIAVTWFNKHPPLTAEGMDVYLSSLIAMNKKDQAKEVISDWWSGALLSTKEQTHFISSYGDYISRQSHICRMDTLLLTGYYTNGKKIAGILGEDYVALARARVAISANKGNLDYLISKVPQALKNDPGLMFERLRWRRQHDKNFSAMEILHNAPEMSKLSNPDDWWRERHIIARRLIKKSQFESAYLLTAGHKQKSGVSFAQAEWLAGWIALRKLEKPEQAYEHFRELYEGVSTPISRARGAYWAGLAARDAGKKNNAERWYKKAAKYPETFYGQMAISMLKDERPSLSNAVPSVSISSKRKWYDNEMVQATRILVDSNMHKEASKFINAMLNKSKTANEYAMLADFARDIGHYHDAVKIAAKAESSGAILPEHAFPSMLSSMEKVQGIEWALVHAVILQESSFNPRAVSPAGARGLMQLMPSTAKEMARNQGIHHRKSWLTTRPEHNIRLGSAYLKQLLKKYDNSYVLALAAYNAGPGRVNSWIKEFGDPRKPEVDSVDWVEMIPIYETRNYVQRVMEGIYVYRIKFEGLQSLNKESIHVVSN